MSRIVRSDPFFRFLRQHLAEVLTVSFVLYLAYTALLPLDFSLRPVRSAPVATWWGLCVVAPNVPDTASNIALYIPLGVLVRAALTKHGMGRRLSVLGTLLVGVALSYVTEYSQRYSPSRVCSVSDFLCNLTGAACGACVGNVLVAIIRAKAADWHDDLIHRPVSVLARLWAIVLFTCALVPFDVTFSRDRLVAAVRRSYALPLRKLADIEARALGAATTGGDAYYAGLRDWWMLCLDYAAQAMGFALLAVLILRYLRRHCNVSPGRARRWAVAACVLLAIVTTTSQLFILSRGFDGTCVLVAAVGALVGAMVHAPWLRHWHPHVEPDDDAAHRSRKRILTAAMLGVSAIIVLRETAPFRVVATLEAVARQAARADWLPLESYFRAQLPVAAHDMIWKLIWFALLGAAVALWRAALPNPTGTRPWGAGLVVAAGVAGLELVQLLLPSRTPAVTDVLLAFCGTAAGVQVYRLASTCYEETRTSPCGVPSAPVLYNVQLGPPGEGPLERVPDRAAGRTRRDR